MEIASLIFSTLAFVFSIINFIEHRAAKLSTHQFQMVDPVKDWEKELDQINVIEKENNDLDNIF